MVNLYFYVELIIIYSYHFEKSIFSLNVILLLFNIFIFWIMTIHFMIFSIV